MQTEEDLVVRFAKDVDDIASLFIEKLNLKHTRRIPNLSSPLLRWTDFTSRYIPPAPRQVALSKELSRNLSPTIKQSLRHLIKKIQAGEDINPYQGRGLIDDHDTSSKRNCARTDLLFADWGIHHLHLTTSPIENGEYFSTRSDWHLFLWIQNNIAFLIDVASHKARESFENINLLKIIYNNWPEVLDPYKVNGILPSHSRRSNAEVKQLRKGSLNSFINIAGNLYISPGGGITSASTSLLGSRLCSEIMDLTDALAKSVFLADGFFKKSSIDYGIANPEYSLVMSPRGLAVYEQESSVAFLLPKPSTFGQPTNEAQLNLLLAPDWATKFLFNSN